METGSKIDLVESPPVYSISPKGWTREKKKKVVIISVVVIVLSLIAVAAILIGVKMTQNHTEKIFQMTFKNPDGSESQQTTTVNKPENVVTFYVAGTNSSSTVLYDYSNVFPENGVLPPTATVKSQFQRAALRTYVSYTWKPESLICVRMDSAVCYLTKMDKSKIPSLDSISKSFQNMQTSSGSSGKPDAEVSYTVQKEPVADRSVLGHSINVLCSNIPIQWAQETTGAQSRRLCFRVFGCYFRGWFRICGYYIRCF